MDVSVASFILLSILTLEAGNSLINPSEGLFLAHQPINGVTYVEPDELWALAAEVARKEGINRTSTELRVEWNHLKRRMAAASGASRKPAPPTFVELVRPKARPLPECTLELEGRRGKLRIQLKNASASFLATLSRELNPSVSPLRCPFA